MRTRKQVEKHLAASRKSAEAKEPKEPKRNHRQRPNRRPMNGGGTNGEGKARQEAKEEKSIEQ